MEILRLTLTIGFSFGFLIGLFIGVGLAKYLDSVL